MPCVCSNVGGIPEVVLDQETGYLIDLKSADSEKDAARAIIRLIRNRELREKLGLSASKRIREKYSQDFHYRRMVDIVEGMIDPVNRN